MADYKYDRFGRTLSSSVSLASANIYRFSSKELMTQCGFYCYGFRFYDPITQRWPNRDPIDEPGFNLLIQSQNPFTLDEEKRQLQEVHARCHPTAKQADPAIESEPETSYANEHATDLGSNR